MRNAAEAEYFSTLDQQVCVCSKDAYGEDACSKDAYGEDACSKTHVYVATCVVVLVLCMVCVCSKDRCVCVVKTRMVSVVKHMCMWQLVW